MFESAFRSLFFSNPATLSLKNKNLVVQKSHNNTKKSTNSNPTITIPLNDILCIVLESHQITITSALLNALALQKITVFCCDSSHLPSGLFLPLNGHYRALKVMNTQINMSKQKSAILWQQIIKSKLSNQSKVLSMIDSPKAAHLLDLANSVRLGDSTNNEAMGAQVYFPAIFGVGFVREGFYDETQSSINAALNYGYAIVRGIVARSLCASGLNPALGINHNNSFNAFNLADDIMEPYRPFVDSVVINLWQKGMLSDFLHQESKLQLVQTLNAKVLLNAKSYPLHRAVALSVQSLVKALDSTSKLILPIFDEVQSNGREIYESDSDV